MKLKKEYGIAISILLIILNMILVLTGHILVLDNWFSNHIFYSTPFNNLFLFITNFGSTKYIITLCILFLIFYKPKKDLLHLYGVTIVSTILNNLIKIIIRRPRPTLMGSIVPVFESTFSFPSGHAMASMTFYGFLIYMISKKDLNKTLKVSLIAFLSVLIFMIGFSRIYIRVHYFSDVLTGFLCSIIVLYFYTKWILKK